MFEINREPSLIDQVLYFFGFVRRSKFNETALRLEMTESELAHERVTICALNMMDDRLINNFIEIQNNRKIVEKFLTDILNENREHFRLVDDKVERNHAEIRAGFNSNFQQLNLLLHQPTVRDFQGINVPQPFNSIVPRDSENLTTQELEVKKGELRKLEQMLFNSENNGIAFNPLAAKARIANENNLKEQIKNLKNDIETNTRNISETASTSHV